MGLVSDGVQFTVLNVLLGVSSLIAFLTPLRCGLHESALTNINAYSCGLLIGCALAVILPEGFEATSHEHGHDHDQDDEEPSTLALLIGYIVQLLFDVLTKRIMSPRKANGMVMVECGDSRLKSSPRADYDDCWDPDAIEHDMDDERSEHAPMMEHEKRARQSSVALLSTDGLRPRGSTCASTRSSHAGGSGKSPVMSTFAGLLVHCAADGLALGASSLSKSDALRWGVFIALSLHKAPVAFATGTLILSHQRQSPRGVRADVLLRYALAFSAASPLTAVIVYSVLHGHALEKYVGQGLLFSAGTFIYVIGHIVPETLHSAYFRGPHWWVGLLCMLAGAMTLPLLLSVVPHVDH